MTIENVGGATVVTGEHIELVQLLAIRGALKMEMSGLKRRGPSASSIVKARFGFKGNKEKLLAQLQAYIEARFPVPTN